MLSTLGHGQYYLYDDTCLDYYANEAIVDYLITEKTYRKEHQVIPFCRRDDGNTDESMIVDDGIPSFTFDELNERNITSLQLYQWSIHADVVEEYQAFLQDEHHRSNVSFHNCSTKQKLGLYCQYSFDSQLSYDVRFEKIVTIVLKKSPTLASNGTCYMHLNCMRNNYSWCLDWREICDGLVDCWPDPVDERLCHQMEQNECGPNEHRCRNGQCIPASFLIDNGFNPDCLDMTDESLSGIDDYPLICKRGDPSFRCMDITRYHWSNSLTPLQYCGGGGSCRTNRLNQFHYTLLSRDHNYHLTDECWSAMICLTQPQLFNGSCDNVCSKPTLSCHPRIYEHCPIFFEFPALPVGWNQIHLVFSWNKSNDSDQIILRSCYDADFCVTSPSDIRFTKLSEPSRILSCQSDNDKPFYKFSHQMIIDYRKIMNLRCSSTLIGTVNDCPSTTQFQCGNRCLSKHRLTDYFNDCFDNMDEDYNQSCALNHKYRQPCLLLKDKGNITQCISPVTILMGNVCAKAVSLPHFPTLCDGYVDHTEKINEQIENDETHCEKWQCDNQYTRCDGFWNCRNGADEAQCSHPVCNGTRGYPCILANTTEFICLPLSYIDDGRIDCFGATDERYLCKESQSGEYRCPNNEMKTFSREGICVPYDQVCIDHTVCPLDHQKLSPLCEYGMNSEYQCNKFWSGDRRVTKYNIFCTFEEVLRVDQFQSDTAPHFSLTNFSIRPPLPFVKRSIVLTQQENSLSNTSHCHGGIPIYVANHARCLCPPTFYGPRCEYQSQRISVALRIGAPNWRTPFALVAYLYDDASHRIDSYYHIQYLSIRDCSIKFNFHLLYASRPKAADRIYSIRIDAFEMMTLKYHASWFFPILFPFLPVYRLSTQITIPLESMSSDLSCPIRCPSPHGRCAIFVNTGQFFCQCQSGWSGPSCTIPLDCNCSPDSMCTGTTTKNKSICVCPTHKFGQRCYLSNDLCKQQPQAKKCLNGGQCIPRDPRIAVGDQTVCSCPDGLHGKQCELNETRIDLVISVPNLHEFLLLHFITVRSHMASIPHKPTKQWGPHERATMFKRIPLDSHSVTIYWEHLFHLLFAEYNGDMYLLHIQPTSTRLTRYEISIDTSKRCPNISELLNDTIIQFIRLHRVKYYHVPCQERLDLPCFHDDDQYLCLCTYDRRANCLTFEHHMNYNCSELSYCANGGLCFQNMEKCPTAARCACPKCFLGTRCQISTQGFGLSLDIILGYQIRLGRSFNDQPLTIKVSGFITFLMLLIGLINGILSILTFQQKILREVGCGIYLLTASIISILTMIVFILKYVLLILTQLLVIKNLIVLKGQCILLDFLLKGFLQMGDWLNACVAFERLLSAMLGIGFNKTLSRTMTKWIILFLAIFVIGSAIHEPLYRILITDEDEGRIWCITRYPQFYSNLLTKYTTTISTIHFIGPFAINIISSFGIIAIVASKRSKVQDKLVYRTHFYKQLQRHKNLIISPFLLILLALPRIILAFTLECIKSAREPVTLYLIGYFISFVPPILLFVVFVLPSALYRKQFKQVFTRQ